jgi:hypothetical protein
MPLYSAYGLCIDSEIALPELPATEGTPDIVIRRGTVRVPSDAASDSDDYVRVDDSTLVYRSPYGRFRLSSARELTVDASPGVSSTSLRLAILGRALGALLQWRGLFVLHASAIVRRGSIVAFAGESGVGKSTTALAHLARGARLVADDLVAIDLSADHPRVLPAFPQMKLWPDAAEAFGIDIVQHERVHERLEKRMIAVEPRFVSGAADVLAEIFILAEGAPTRVEALDLQGALVELLRHSYAPRIMRALGLQGRHMEQCARLASMLPVRRLVVDRSRSVEEIVDLIDGEASR